MQALKIELKHKLMLVFFSTLLSAFNPATAESDKQMQDKLLRAREALQHGEHASHADTLNKGRIFVVFITDIFPVRKRIAAALKSRCP